MTQKSRTIATRTLILISGVGIAVALAMSFGATFSAHLGPIHIRGSDPSQPLLIAAFTGWAGAFIGRFRSTSYLGWMIGTVACATLVAIKFVGSNADEYATGDAALLELYTLHTVRGIWTLGPYSRFGWHHPGPLYFYFLAPLYSAGHFHFLALNVGAAFINFASLITLLVVVGRYAAKSLVLCLPIVLAIYIVQVTPIFVSAWNPHVIVFAVGALVVVSAAVASGHLSLAAFAIVIGSFCAQTHIAVVPTVVALWGFAFAAIALQVRSGQIAAPVARKCVNLVMWAAVLCWFLPLAQELVSRPGNLTAIMRFLVAVEKPRPFLESLHVWAQMTVSVVTGQLSVPRGWALSVEPSRVPTILAIGQLILLMVVSSFALRNGRHFEAALSAAGALALLVALWSALHIATAIEDHQVFWISVLGALNWAVLIAFIAETLVERFIRWPLKRLALVVYSIFLAMILFRPIQILRLMHRNAGTEDVIGEQIKASADAIGLDMSSQGVRRAIVRSSANAWAEHAGVVLDLYKRRLSIGVAREATFMFGTPLALTGYETVEYFVYSATDYEHSVRQPDADLLLRRANVVITRRACTGPDPARPCL